MEVEAEFCNFINILDILARVDHCKFCSTQEEKGLLVEMLPVVCKQIKDRDYFLSSL